MKKVIAKKVKRPRQGWEAFFKLMRARGEDRLLIPDALDLLPASNKRLLDCFAGLLYHDGKE